MKNIFTWISGLQTGSLLGFIGGILLISLGVIIAPDAIIKLCEEYKK